MVLRTEDDRSRESLEAVVQSGDGFQVEVCGRFVEQQAVRVRKHHLRKHAAHLFATGKDVRRFQRFFAGKEHTTEESADERFVLFLAVLAQPIHEGEVRLEVSVVVLREVVVADGVAPLEHAFRSLCFFGNELEERGLERVVFTDESDLVLVAEREVESLADDAVAAVDGGILDFEHNLARFAVHLEVHPRELTAGGRHFFDGHLVQKLLAAGGLLCLGGIRCEAADERLEFFNLFFGAAVLVLALLLGELACCIPEFVVTTVNVDLAVVDIASVRADGVQEVTVMAHHDHDVFEAFEVVFEPADSFQIKVVRRFVQEQNVRVAKQSLGEEHADFLATIEFGHQVVVEFFGNAKSLEEHCCVGVGFVTADFAKASLDFHGLHALFFGHFRERVKFVTLLAKFVEFRETHHHGFENGIVFVGKVVLLQNGDTFARVLRDFTRVRFEFARKNFEECGFAGTVCADDTVAVASLKGKVHFFEEDAATILETDIGYIKHGAKDSKKWGWIVGGLVESIEMRMSRTTGLGFSFSKML